MAPEVSEICERIDGYLGEKEQARNSVLKSLDGLREDYVLVLKNLQDFEVKGKKTSFENYKDLLNEKFVLEMCVEDDVKKINCRNNANKVFKKGDEYYLNTIFSINDQSSIEELNKIFVLTGLDRVLTDDHDNFEEPRFSGKDILNKIHNYPRDTLKEGMFVRTTDREGEDVVYFMITESVGEEFVDMWEKDLRFSVRTIE